MVSDHPIHASVDIIRLVSGFHLIEWHMGKSVQPCRATTSKLQPFLRRCSASMQVVVLSVIRLYDTTSLS